MILNKACWQRKGKQALGQNSALTVTTRGDEEFCLAPLQSSTLGSALPPRQRHAAHGTSGPSALTSRGRGLPRLPAVPPRRHPRRARTDWRSAAGCHPPEAGTGHLPRRRLVAAPGAGQCMGREGARGAGQRFSVPARGRAEGRPLPVRPRASPEGRRRRRCMRPAGGRAPGRQHGGAERGRRKVMRS